jgi:hypothetical protein
VSGRRRRRRLADDGGAQLDGRAQAVTWRADHEWRRPELFRAMSPSAHKGDIAGIKATMFPDFDQGSHPVCKSLHTPEAHCPGSREFEYRSPSGSAPQHKLQTLQAAQELHQRRIVTPPSRGSGTRPKRRGRQHLRFRLEVHFRIDVGGVDRDVPQPREDRVDVDARAQQVGCGRVALIRRVELST